MSAPAVELSGITKRYPGVVANDGVEFRARSEEIHAIVGENGAGKTTLMRVLAGLTRPDAGEIRIDGAPVRFRSAADAASRGVGMVHQHFTLVPVFTVLENVALGAEPALLGDLRATRARLLDLAAELGFPVDPDAHVLDLSVGERQRVEILRVLMRGARILILDEPTAVLGPVEAGELYRTLRRLANSGRTVLFISHRLSEVLTASDRITVMRAGRSVATLDAGDADEAALARLMVGREVVFPAGAGGGAERDTEPALSVTGLSVVSDRGLAALTDVDVTVREGEVVGVAGVVGNGQTELVEAIAGLRPVAAGTLRIGGEDVTETRVLARIRAGLSTVPEDRLDRGLVPALSAEENIALGKLRDSAVWRGPYLFRASLRRSAVAEMEALDVRPLAPGAAVADFSGGNQQKLLLSRALTGASRVLVLAEPTRGLDVGAIERVHAAIRGRCEEGAGVLLVSSDLDELLALSDRLLVLRRGRIAGELEPGATTEEELGLLMAGGEG